MSAIWSLTAFYSHLGSSGPENVANAFLAPREATLCCRSRPGLDAMVAAAAERREFDVLVVWALDRVGRSTLHTLEILEKLDALGSHFRSYTQGASPRMFLDDLSQLPVRYGTQGLARMGLREYAVPPPESCATFRAGLRR